MKRCKTIRTGRKCKVCGVAVSRTNYRGWYWSREAYGHTSVTCPRCASKIIAVPIWEDIFYDA